MVSRVEGVANVIRALANLERRSNGAARKGVAEATRKIQLGIRAEVGSIFTKNTRAGNAVRSVVYDNVRGGQQASGHRSDAAGLIFSKFGRGRGAAYVDYLAPYITGRDIEPRQARYLAIPLQKGKKNRRPTPEMNLAAVRIGGELFLVKNMRNKTLFMFRLVSRVKVTRRLRLAGLLRGGGNVLTAEVMRAYASLAGEMRK